MKFSLLLWSLVASTSAAPAVVWKKHHDQRFLHSSDEVFVSDLLKTALEGSNLSVIFLVNKDVQGNEQLTELSSGGKLPLVGSKYSEANVYHHVSGVESAPSMVREANKHGNAASASVNDLQKKLAPAQEAEIEGSGKLNKRSKKLMDSNVLVVSLDPKDSKLIDQTISQTIDNEKVESILVAGVRSVHEVKQERMLMNQQRRSLMQTAGDRTVESRRRRRLEQEQGGDDNMNKNNDNDLSGVYYVSMTPNILAGLLFMGLFTVLTWIGLSCLGAIAGQDVFVSKMPSVGREA